MMNSILKHFHFTAGARKQDRPQTRHEEHGAQQVILTLPSTCDGRIFSSFMKF